MWFPKCVVCNTAVFEAVDTVAVLWLIVGAVLGAFVPLWEARPSPECAVVERTVVVDDVAAEILLVMLALSIGLDSFAPSHSSPDYALEAIFVLAAMESA